MASEGPWPSLGMPCQYLSFPRPFPKEPLALGSAFHCGFFQFCAIFRDKKERTGWQDCRVGSELLQQLL